MSEKTKSGERVLARNRRAFRDYDIEETVEGGLKLLGTEVKSIREGNISLQEAYAAVEGGEVFLHNMHVGPYSHGSIYNHEPKRRRKVLLHRKEIDRLYGSTREQGYTLIPLKLYLTRGWIKVELAVARGKKQYDKREQMKKDEAQRRMQQAIRRPL